MVVDILDTDLAFDRYASDTCVKSYRLQSTSIDNVENLSICVCIRRLGVSHNLGFELPGHAWQSAFLILIDLANQVLVVLVTAGVYDLIAAL